MARKSKSNFGPNIDPATGELLQLHQRPAVRRHAKEELREIRRQDASRMRRLGRGAIRAASVVVAPSLILFEHIDNVSLTEMAQREVRESRSTHQFIGRIATALPGFAMVAGIKLAGNLGGKLVGRGARNYAATQRDRAENQREQAMSTASEAYAQQYPDEVRRLRRQEHRKKIAEAQRAAHEYSVLKNRFAIRDLVGRNGHRNPGAFVRHSMGQLPDGLREGTQISRGYQHILAANSILEAAHAPRNHDGTVTLIGGTARNRHAKTAVESGHVSRLNRIENDFNAGAAFALLDLGILRTTGEVAVQQGLRDEQVEFNPDLQWSIEEPNADNQYQTIHHARLAFDPDNELHSMLTPLVPNDLRGRSDLSLRLDFSLGSEHSSGNEYLNISVVAPQTMADHSPTAHAA